MRLQSGWPFLALFNVIVQCSLCISPSLHAFARARPTECWSWISTNSLHIKRRRVRQECNRKLIYLIKKLVLRSSAMSATLATSTTSAPLFLRSFHLLHYIFFPHNLLFFFSTALWRRLPSNIFIYRTASEHKMRPITCDERIGFGIGINPLRPEYKIRITNLSPTIFHVKYGIQWGRERNANFRYPMASGAYQNRCGPWWIKRMQKEGRGGAVMERERAEKIARKCAAVKWVHHKWCVLLVACAYALQLCIYDWIQNGDAMRIADNAMSNKLRANCKMTILCNLFLRARRSTIAVIVKRESIECSASICIAPAHKQRQMQCLPLSHCLLLNLHSTV